MKTAEESENAVLSMRQIPDIEKSFIAEENEAALFEARGRPLLPTLNPTIDALSTTNKSAWAAGVLDVHGTFVADPPQVRVTMARNPAVLRRLRALFGGRIYPTRVARGGVWVVTGSKRVSVLVAGILPHVTKERRNELRGKYIEYSAHTDRPTDHE